MWFDEIMDDCKKALQIANSKKSIFVPVFLKLGLNILFFVYFIAVIIGFGIRFIRNPIGRYQIFGTFIRELPGIFIALFIAYLLYVVGNSLIEVGSINLYKVSAFGIKPGSSDFFQGVKSYFLKVLGGTLFIHLILLLLSPVIIALYLIYITVIGTLTAGWGITFLSVFIMVFLTAWTTIVVVDNASPIQAISLSIRLGRRYFWGLFIIMLSNVMLARYLATAFGPFATLLAGWFIGGIVYTYFKLVVLLIYNRKRIELS